MWLSNHDHLLPRELPTRVIQLTFVSNLPVQVIYKIKHEKEINLTIIAGVATTCQMMGL
jgi:hypothetical protein